MIQNIAPGVFYPGNGLLHRLQARTKLLVVGLAIVVLVIANQREWHFAPYIVAGGLVLASVLGSGIPLRMLGRRLLILFAVVFSSILLSLLGGSSNSPVVLRLGSLPLIGPILITQDQVWIMVITFAVFVVIYTLSLLLTMTTNPVALIEGLTLLFSPLRRLSLPVDDFALMALLALRFIPTLLDEAEQLLKAQSARGADLLHGTLRERMQSFASLFVALVQGALRRAAELATALEARGYRSQGQRTLLYEQPLGVLDYLVLFIVGFALIGSLFL